MPRPAIRDRGIGRWVPALQLWTRPGDDAVALFYHLHLSLKEFVS